MSIESSRSCPSADGRPESMKCPGARASCPQRACNCGAKGGQDARAPGYPQSRRAEKTLDRDRPSPLGTPCGLAVSKREGRGVHAGPRF